MIDGVMDHLEALVAFRTENPPRDIQRDSPMFDYLIQALGPGFDIDITDHGAGSVTLLAVRGTPEVLFNVHLDTVPALPGSKYPPLKLTREEHRLYGRGACDIKGAAACLLTLASLTQAPMALLFTTDEEGGEGCCVREFLSAGRADSYAQVVVAEPTLCKAEFRHRGFISARGAFSGVSGHSSEPRALEDNALHALARWSQSALSFAAAEVDAGRRTCFNIGTVDGGVKSNVIADQAGIFWSARLPPGASNEAFLETLTALEWGDRADWTLSFNGPPLPTDGHDSDASRVFADRCELPTGNGLDFWTEAALFGRAGVPALVLGPGNIEQAHTLDEWVAIDQLELAVAAYRRIVEAA